MNVNRPVITPPEGNQTIDGLETEIVAFRLAHAVARYNFLAAQMVKSLASFEVFADPDDAVPPIDAPSALIDLEERQLYTRLSYPDAAAIDEIQGFELALTRVFDPYK